MTRRSLLALALLTGWLAGAASAQETIKIGAPIAMSAPGSVAQGKEVRDGLTIAQEILNKKGASSAGRSRSCTRTTRGFPRRAGRPSKSSSRRTRWWPSRASTRAR